MEWTYLYYIAIFSSAYVSFTSIFLALRQIIGATVDRAAGWATRYLIAVALCTVMTAILPPLLSMFSLSADVAVRLSAAIAVALLGRLDVIYLWRRSSVFCEAMDLRLSILFGVAVVVDLVFAAIACGLAHGDAYATYCAAETAELAIMFRYFSRGLERFLPFHWEATTATRSVSSPDSR